MLFLSSVEAEAALSGRWRWPHFSVGELACRCAGRFCRAEYFHDGEFLDALEALRGEVGRALIINSGHRCGQWNAAVGGAPRSQHKQIAVELGFTGLGMARTFLHLDRRPRPARWFYKGARPLWET